MNTLELSGWSVGQAASGRAALYIPEHPAVEQRIAEVRAECADAVEVSTGPPLRLVG